MDLHSIMWILAAAQSAGDRRLPLGGEEGARSRAAGGAASTGRGAGGAAAAQGGPRAAEGAALTGRGAGAAAAAQGGPRAAGGAAPTCRGAGGAAAAQGGPRAAGGAAPTGRRAGGAAAAQGGPRAVGADPGVVAACLGGAAVTARPPDTSIERAGGATDAGREGQGAAGVQPSEAARVGGGPNGEGWKVGAHLTKEQGTYVAAVVERNRDAFAYSLEEIGEFKLFEVELKLKSDQPIFKRRRRHSVREWELVDERCRELEAAGLIEECDSDFAANSVMAAKKDPEENWKLARFCTDLRRTNEQTAQDRYPMPLPEEVLEGLGHAKFYSTIDIRGTFHQLVVKQADRRKLAFWSSSKLYCWKR
jgi:hypothetical protein